MSHHYSLRSNAPSRDQFNDDGPQMLADSEAIDLIQLNDASENTRDSQEMTSQTDGASHNNSVYPNTEEQNESSHTHTTQTRGPGFVDAARSATHKLISEVEKLRAEKVQYENLIKKLWQELNLKHEQIEQLSNVYQQKAVPKLPDFTGSHDDEKSDIWITRFNEALYKFNSPEKLGQLLPRLRGIAADFVFDQLSPEVRSEYHALVYELRKRFQTFETPRMYQSQYEKRRQKSGEDAHSFASELKRLYDKAYPGRPRSIRDEDLVRKFFDGLLDVKASVQVEYHKNPTSIDHAVYEVIRYMEIIGGPQSTSHSTEADLN